MTHKEALRKRKELASRLPPLTEILRGSFAEPRWTRSADQPALRPLPTEGFQYGEWPTARVNIDYHIEFERP